MNDSTSHSPIAEWWLTPTNEAPSAGPSTVQDAPRNSSEKRAGRLMSVIRAQTRSGDAAMSTSAHVPGSSDSFNGSLGPDR